MRALMELVETGALMVRTVDLEAKLDADTLAAFRSAGILRGTDCEGHEEISPSDFIRALRALYRVEGRGLPVAGASKKHREQHGPGRWVHIEALEEALSTKGGRLARGDRELPQATGSPPAPASPSAKVQGLERWNQLRVCKVHSKMVRFDVGKKRYRRTAADVGMAHKSTRVPKQEWDLLIEVCDGHGYFKSWKYGSADATRKTVERLAKAMCRYFGLEDSPFHRYRRDSGWRAKFVAEPRLPSGVSEGEDED